MLDDIREWISDNLRYILLGLAVILVFIIVFCVIRLVGGSGGSSKGSQNIQPAATTGAVQGEAATEADDAGTSGAEAGSASQANASQTAGSSAELTRNDAAVLTLVKKYYDAAVEKDVGTLSQIVSPWDNSVQSDILSNDVIEAYNNITTYSKKGVTEGSYVVYAYYDSKITGIDTLVPSLSRLYVVTNESGNLVVSSNADQDQTVSDYINTVSGDADVMALISDVNKQYQAAVDSDDKLKEYIDTLSNGSGNGEEGSAGEAGETGSGQEMTAIAGLNIRQEPSTESAILGSVIAGTNVTVLEQVQDGWCRISYATNQGVVEGYVRLEYLTAVDSAA